MKLKLKLFDAAALILSLAVCLLFFLYGIRLNSETGYLRVQDEKGDSLYSLSEDRTIVVEGPIGESVIVIEDSSAHFEHSDCQDQLCVLMGAIGGGGEWAACLPNRVFIYIEGEGEQDETDTLSY